MPLESASLSPVYSFSLTILFFTEPPAPRNGVSGDRDRDSGTLRRYAVFLVGGYGITGIRTGGFHASLEAPQVRESSKELDVLPSM
jgi:hypothetical protein